MKLKLLTKTEREIIADSLASWAETFEHPRTIKRLQGVAARVRRGTAGANDMASMRFQLGQKYQCETDYDNAEEKAAVLRLFA